MRLIDADKLIHDNIDYFDSAHGEQVAEELRYFVKSAPTMNPVQWISTEVMRPPRSEELIVVVDGTSEWNRFTYHNAVIADDCVYENGRWYIHGVYEPKITVKYWMPLPEPPEFNEMYEKLRNMVIGGEK